MSQKYTSPKMGRRSHPAIRLLVLCRVKVARVCVNALFPFFINSTREPSVACGIWIVRASSLWLLFTVRNAAGEMPSAMPFHPFYCESVNWWSVFSPLINSFSSVSAAMRNRKIQSSDYKLIPHLFVIGRCTFGPRSNCNTCAFSIGVVRAHLDTAWILCAH